MKSIISIAILFFSTNVLSRDIIVVSYNKKNETLHELQHELEINLSIPKKLIKYSKEKAPCTPKKSAIIHACIEDDEIKFPIINKKITTSAFSIFIENETSIFY